MNKTDRMLAIVLELQSKGWQRAEDLASTFETSKRTIYRDIQALSEAGVPLLSLPGRGYSLMEGYFLPPLSFSSDEATMLLLGSDVMEQSFDEQYRTAAQSAGRKIAGVLPAALRNEVQYLQQNIRFVVMDNVEAPAERQRLQQLRRAILEQTSIRFDYYAKRRSDEQSIKSSRQADPYALIHFHTSWQLVAYCHLRQDMRNFRLDRMEQLELLPNRFQRRADFILEQQDEPRPLLVRVLCHPTIVRWVRESRFYYITHEEETSQGLLLTLHIRHEDDIFQWLLGWGRHVQVLEPISLQRRLLEETHAIAKMYAE